MHTKERRNNSRSTSPQRHDHHRKSQPHRVLRPEESFYASRMVCSRRPVPVSIRRTSHRKEETPLGTFRPRRLVHRLSSISSLWFQHTGRRNGHHRLAHHAREPFRLVRAQTHRRRSSDGWYILSLEDIRLCRRHGQIGKRPRRAHGRTDAPDQQRSRRQGPQYLFPNQGGLGEPQNRVYRADNLEGVAQERSDQCRRRALHGMFPFLTTFLLLLSLDLAAVRSVRRSVWLRSQRNEELGFPANMCAQLNKYDEVVQSLIHMGVDVVYPVELPSQASLNLEGKNCFEPIVCTYSRGVYWNAIH